MKKYQKFQFGWVIVISFFSIIIFITIAYIFQWGNNPMDQTGYILFLILFGVLLLVFYGMTIIVTDKQLILKFGIGLFTKKIDLSTISSVEIKKFPLIYGYGIRLIPNGILYNVSGRYAIELKRTNKKSVLQIGSNDCENLKAIIEERINNNLH